MQLTIEQIITAFGAICAVVATLSGVIAHLYRKISQAQISTEKKLADCEQAHKDTQDEIIKNHKDTYEKIIELNREVGSLKGMEQMHDAVIKEVRKLRDDG